MTLQSLIAVVCVTNLNTIYFVIVCCYVNRAFHNSILILLISFIADSGYGVRRYLFTPTLNPATEAGQLYNQTHIRRRNVVDRCFGVLERRFSDFAYGCRLKLETILEIMVATSILHNIAINMGEEEPPPIPEVVHVVQQQLINDGQIPPIENVNHVEHQVRKSTALRRIFINNYFNCL